MQLKELAVNNVSSILELDIESVEKRKEVLQSIRYLRYEFDEVILREKLPLASICREFI